MYDMKIMYEKKNIPNLSICNFITNLHSIKNNRRENSVAHTGQSITCLRGTTHTSIITYATWITPFSTLNYHVGMQILY